MPQFEHVTRGSRRTILPGAGKVALDATSSASVALPMCRENQDRGDDLVGLAELLAVDKEIAEPLGRAHELGRDHEHPAESETGAQRRR